MAKKKFTLTLSDGENSIVDGGKYQLTSPITCIRWGKVVTYPTGTVVIVEIESGEDGILVYASVRESKNMDFYLPNLSDISKLKEVD